MVSLVRNECSIVNGSGGLKHSYMYKLSEIIDFGTFYFSIYRSISSQLLNSYKSASLKSNFILYLFLIYLKIYTDSITECALFFYRLLFNRWTHRTGKLMVSNCSILGTRMKAVVMTDEAKMETSLFLTCILSLSNRNFKA